MSHLSTLREVLPPSVSTAFVADLFANAVYASSSKGLDNSSHTVVGLAALSASGHG